ncbi:hypothetical protein LZ480_13940 [Solibacillus sp. MA9]|uniref:Uncharacterized protein n=1 Tax=Solibacillus palustris TaxID=2908203 RepID=A0ABS9UGC9_9BACL|nr:hypothetical protein [Solibacillus sp. MA9]MCH7322975.1 hypothetical protein [Solibacillus sp. MA9]
MKKNFEVFHVNALKPGQIIFEDISVENLRGKKDVSAQNVDRRRGARLYN